MAKGIKDKNEKPDHSNVELADRDIKPDNMAGELAVKKAEKEAVTIFYIGPDGTTRWGKFTLKGGQQIEVPPAIAESMLHSPSLFTRDEATAKRLVMDREAALLHERRRSMLARFPGMKADQISAALKRAGVLPEEIAAVLELAAEE